MITNKTFLDWDFIIHRKYWSHDYDDQIIFKGCYLISHRDVLWLLLTYVWKKTQDATVMSIEVRDL